MIRAGVIGWPVAHSRSPLIHGYWLKRYRIDGSYDRHAVEPGTAAAFVRSLRERGLSGCNVTLPHKEAVYAAADETLPAARAAGAANTLWFENDRLMADNTDAAGYLNSLLAAVPGLDLASKTVAVLGAGGAARGIIFALLGAGVGTVHVFNRTRTRADAVATYFGAKVNAHDWNRRVAGSRGADLIVNTTALGLAGGDPLDMDVSQLKASCIVSDIVYVPLETPLLAAAKTRGLRTVDGLDMLLHQAVPGFEKWFGVRPEVTPELRALLVLDIEGT